MLHNLIIGAVISSARLRLWDLETRLDQRTTERKAGSRGGGGGQSSSVDWWAIINGTAGRVGIIAEKNIKTWSSRNTSDNLQVHSSSVLLSYFFLPSFRAHSKLAKTRSKNSKPGECARESERVVVHMRVCVLVCVCKSERVRCTRCFRKTVSTKCMWLRLRKGNIYGYGSFVWFLPRTCTQVQ